MYTWDGARLSNVWVEEDHHLARIQLRSGRYALPKQLPGPADPWSMQSAPPAEGATDAAARWLASGGDGRLGGPVTVDALLVVGDRFGFHSTSPTVHVAGMASVGADGSIEGVSIFSDGGTP